MAFRDQASGQSAMTTVRQGRRSPSPETQSSGNGNAADYRSGLRRIGVGN